jgi:hypothetical protein
MTTITRIPRPLHPWKIKQLPTIQCDLSSQILFRNHNTQIIQLHPAFILRANPIQPLKTRPCPHLAGPRILQAFLWARKRFPGRPVLKGLPWSFQAVYESRRVDGLPRVVFVVSKDISVPLRGKMSGVIRHRAKNRGRTAFKLALEGLRRTKKGMSRMKLS